MIELADVSLTYRQGGAVLRNVSLSMAAGSLHFLTGPSGAGKSSFLRLLYLALSPSEGRLTLFGRDASRLSRSEIATLRRRIGVVFQDFQLLSHLSVYENVSLPLIVAGARERDYHADVMEMLDWVQLADKARLSPNRLSGGEKQRVAIARAVVSNPELIVADEPTGNVDPAMAERIMSLLVEMHRLGRTVIVATHDVALVDRFGGARLHLDNGRLSAPRPAGAAAKRFSADFEQRLQTARQARAASSHEHDPFGVDPFEDGAWEAAWNADERDDEPADAPPKPSGAPSRPPSPKLFPQKAAAS